MYLFRIFLTFLCELNKKKIKKCNILLNEDNTDKCLMYIIILVNILYL